jgi:hypothetical protein
VEQPAATASPAGKHLRTPRFRVLRHEDDPVERVVQMIEKQVLDGRFRRVRQHG